MLQLQKLKLPEYEFDIKVMNDNASIYDRIRKKYVKLTPEEWVRQNFIAYLIEGKGCPFSRVRLEVALKYGNMQKRCDALIYDKDFNPVAILECKAPEVSLSSKTLRQIGSYNMHYHVDTLIITNGINHFTVSIDRINGKFGITAEIPNYSEMAGSK